MNHFNQTGCLNSTVQVMSSGRVSMSVREKKKNKIRRQLAVTSRLIAQAQGGNDSDCQCQCLMKSRNSEVEQNKTQINTKSKNLKQVFIQHKSKLKGPCIPLLCSSGHPISIYILISCHSLEWLFQITGSFVNNAGCQNAFTLKWKVIWLEVVTMKTRHIQKQP